MVYIYVSNLLIRMTRVQEGEAGLNSFPRIKVWQWDVCFWIFSWNGNAEKREKMMGLIQRFLPTFKRTRFEAFKDWIFIPVEKFSFLLFCCWKLQHSQKYMEHISKQAIYIHTDTIKLKSEYSVVEGYWSKKVSLRLLPWRVIYNEKDWIFRK